MLQPQPPVPPSGAVVTGAASGIGLACVRRLAGDGYLVTAIDRDRAALLAADLPDDALRVVADIGDPDLGWMEQVLDREVVPTVLVNNAYADDGCSFLELSDEQLTRSLATNLIGTWRITRRFVDAVLEAEATASVVFVSSLHGSTPRGRPTYSVGKAGLLALAAEAAVELAGHGIRVNSVLPGIVDTWPADMVDRDQHVADSSVLPPMGRPADAAEIADVVAFLAGLSGSSYITGAEIHVDGGLRHRNWIHHLYDSSDDERRRTQQHNDPEPTG